MSHRVASLRTGERAALLAAEEACALATALAVAPHDPTGVHEARKSLRRLRSLLALVRDALGKEAVDAIDDELRAMTRDLSALRDGQVVQDVARLLAREATDPAERENWQALLPALAGRHEQVLAAALCEDPGFMRRQAQAHRQAEHLRQLPWQRLKAGDLRHALARSERRQARAQAKAMASSAEDAAHAEQLLERLNVSLGQLSPRQQQIFILSRLHGCSYQEIADQLEVSLSTVQKELKLIMAICVGVAERLDQP